MVEATGFEPVTENKYLDKSIETIQFNLESCLEKYKETINTKSTNSLIVKQYLESFNYLEQLNLIKALGHDGDCVLTYLVFGNKYVGVNDDKCRVALRHVIEFVNSR